MRLHILALPALAEGAGGGEVFEAGWVRNAWATAATPPNRVPFTTARNSGAVTAMRADLLQIKPTGTAVVCIGFPCARGG